MRPRLVYFDQWTDPIAREMLVAGDIDLTRLEITGSVDENWAGLERAHGFTRADYHRRHPAGALGKKSREAE